MNEVLAARAARLADVFSRGSKRGWSLTLTRHWSVDARTTFVASLGSEWAGEAKDDADAALVSLVDKIERYVANEIKCGRDRADVLDAALSEAAPAKEGGSDG